MSSVNKVVLVGNLGDKPDIRATQDGREIANLSIATSQKWKDKNTGEAKEKTEWHRVVVFSPGLVNVIKQYVHKGSKVYVEGALQTRKWQDQQGQDRYSTEVVLQGYNSNLVLLDSRNNQQTNSQPSYQAQTAMPQQNPQPANFTAEELDDEIPF